MCSTISTKLIFIVPRWPVVCFNLFFVLSTREVHYFDIIYNNIYKIDIFTIILHRYDILYIFCTPPYVNFTSCHCSPLWLKLKLFTKKLIHTIKIFQLPSRPNSLISDLKIFCSNTISYFLGFVLQLNTIFNVRKVELFWNL